MNMPIVFFPSYLIEDAENLKLISKYPIEVYRNGEEIIETLWKYYVNEDSPIVVVSNGEMDEFTKPLGFHHITNKGPFITEYDISLAIAPV